MDKHYWKDAYKDYWEKASKKEEYIKKIIEDETGFTVHEVGLGAGSIEFISGSAKDNNLKKGDADLYVDEPEAFIEVTGPNIPLSFHQPL